MANRRAAFAWAQNAKAKKVDKALGGVAIVVRTPERINGMMVRCVFFLIA